MLLAHVKTTSFGFIYSPVDRDGVQDGSRLPRWPASWAFLSSRFATGRRPRHWTSSAVPMRSRSRRNRWTCQVCEQRTSACRWNSRSKQKRKPTSRRTCGEVCLGRPAGPAVSFVVTLRCAVGQPERLSRVEARGKAGTNATGGHAVADDDSDGTCRVQGRIRFAAHDRENP